MNNLERFLEIKIIYLNTLNLLEASLFIFSIRYLR